MAKFENRYGVRKIVYKQKCRCFCPIGKADYTNEFTVTMEPAEIIPDYCEIDKFIRECLEGESLVIEEAASKLKKKRRPFAEPAPRPLSHDLCESGFRDHQVSQFHS